MIGVRAGDLTGDGNGEACGDFEPPFPTLEAPKYNVLGLAGDVEDSGTGDAT